MPHAYIVKQYVFNTHDGSYCRKRLYITSERNDLLENPENLQRLRNPFHEIGKYIQTEITAPVLK